MRHFHTKSNEDLMRAVNGINFNTHGDPNNSYLRNADRETWTRELGFYPQVYVDATHYEDNPWYVFRCVKEELKLRGVADPVPLRTSHCGKEFIFRDGERYRVIGIFPDIFGNSVLCYQVDNPKRKIGIRKETPIIFF